MWKRLSILWSVIRRDARLPWSALRDPLDRAGSNRRSSWWVIYVLSTVDLPPATTPPLGVDEHIVGGRRSGCRQEGPMVGCLLLPCD